MFGVGIAAVVDARRHDAARFAPNAPAWEWIAALGRGERLILENPLVPHRPVTSEDASGRLQNLTGWPAKGILGIGGPPPTLQTAFESLFTGALRGRAPRDLPRLEVPALRARLVRPAPAQSAADVP